MGITVFIHCNRKFKSFEAWFLLDNKDFMKRKMCLGTCPICGARTVELIETRKYDGAIFRKTFFKKDAEKLIQKMQLQIEHTSADIKRLKKAPFGLCYGENVEIRNHKGEIVEIRQKRCDYFGAKEIILKIKPSYSS